MNIARTTLSSKILQQRKDHFARLAVDAVLRLKGSTGLEAIEVIKKLGGNLVDSYLEEGGIWKLVFSMEMGVEVQVGMGMGFGTFNTISHYNPCNIRNMY